ncbi:MAG TPA: site-specific integrase, partial [Acetobacteraceae bacterium]
QGISFAEVITRLQADPSLTDGRRQAMISALRTLARLLGTDPAALPAEPQGLRHRLAATSPAAGGLSRTRWANIRSLTLAALKQAGLRTMPGRAPKPLDPAWDALRRRLPDAQFRHGLSRFMSFCCTQQVMPGAVNAAHFDRFRQALETDSLVQKTQTVHRTTCILWNRARASIEGWPALSVAVPSASRRYAFAWQDFPPSLHADAEAFLQRMGNQDPFAEDYAVSVRPSTVQLRRRQILQIATALARAGQPIDTITSLAVLVQLDHARQALRFFLARAGGRSTISLHQHAQLLKTIARHWTKASRDQVEALGELTRRLAIKNTGMTSKNRTRLRQFDDPAIVAALIHLPARVLREVQRKDGGGRRDALRVMFALAVELLIIAPVRVDNLAGLETERHFLCPGRGPSAPMHLVIPPEEVKNGVPYELQLPKDSAAFLAGYLATYHRRLCPAPSPWLFPNEQGERRSTIPFSVSISQFVHRETGIQINVHLFRHLAAKLHLEACPEDVETARRILGHKNISTTLRSYAETKTAAAFRRYDGLIASLRERSQLQLTGRGRGR